VHATKGGYADGAYGSRGSDARAVTLPFIGAIGLPLLNGQHVLNADILLWKHASISGVVTDERGEPMVGILVRPLKRTIVSGRPRFVGTGRWHGMTDDRGMYRVSDLPPGHYVVSVESAQATLPVALLAEYFDGASKPGQIQAMEVSRLGSSRNQQFGDHVLTTFSGLPIPLVSGETGRLSVYPTTYAPGVWSIADATVISLAAGEDRPGISLPIRPVPSVRVSGRLVGPAGPLGRRPLRLIPATTGDLVRASPYNFATTTSDASGQFTFLGIPTGAHTLRVDTEPNLEGAQPAMREMLWASQPIVVGNADISDLVVTLRQAIPVNGRVVLVPAPGSQASTALLPALDVNVSFPQDLGAVDTARTQANTKGEFSTALLGGSYYVTAQLPAGWFVKSVVVNDRTIGDLSFDATGESLNITIIGTNAPSRVSVTVRDGEGAPPRSVRAFLFPADRSAWTGYGPATRRLQVLGGNLAFGFIFEGMPAGDYLVAAARDDLTADWPDPRLLEILSRFATRVSVIDGQQQSLDVRLSQIR
jgi:hypothetical protein